MRFRFKSLLILSEQKRRVAGGTETTTLYDLRNIGEHTFDAPTWELRLHPVHLLATPLLSSPVLALTLYIAWAFTEGGVWTSPLLLLVLIAVPLAIFYPLSMHGIVWRRMKAQARRERLLGDNIPIHVVQEKDWDSFHARLKQPDARDQVLLLCDQIAQVKRTLPQTMPLPNDNALRKWDEHQSEAEDRTKRTDQVTERRSDVKPGLGVPNS